MIFELDNYEDLWVQLSQSKIIFCVMYRHPKSNYELFNDSLEQNFALLQKRTFYIVGDMNIDISSSRELSNSLRNYLNMLSSHAIFPIITKQTRVTDTSATTIDHISTNDCNHSVFRGIVTTDLSDHSPVFCKIFNISSFDKPKLLEINHGNGNEFQKNIYKQYSNKLTKVKFLSKRMYYREKLSYFNHEKQKICNLIKPLLPSKSKTTSTVTKIKISNSVTDDLSSIARKFNDYFCDIGKVLANQLPDH